MGFKTLAERFVGGNVSPFFDTQVAKGLGGLVTAIVGLVLVILFARFLYRRQIFLRV